MKPTHMIAISVVVALCACRDSTSVSSEDIDQEQIVHEIAAIAIIKKVSFGEIKGPYVVQETPSLSVFVFGEDEEQELTDLQNRLANVKEIGPELAKNFITANRSPKLFRKDAFPTDFPVVLLSEAKMKELFLDGSDKGWQRFYQAFDSFGMITASQPVFSQDRRSALMMIWHQYGPLQGEGGFVMAKRVGSSWTIFDLSSAPSGVSSVPNKARLDNRLPALLLSSIVTRIPFLIELPRSRQPVPAL